jgi:hypothetical protein
VKVKLRFPNGYALSIIEDGYGEPDAPYEIAVLHGNTLVYDTPVASDVVGWLTAAEVLEYGAKVAALPPRHTQGA